ncbi:hypothetical protein LTR53_017773 [Teratosphaeriaceae sp. CCFEE 6253]|nr:hypothetical protein LTR53_017773 [Teratosphaeriaceae sp. CCFEE 6253]
MARAFGATHMITFKGKDMVELVQEVTGGEGVDYSLDATGVIPVIESMISAAAQNAVCRTVGSAAIGAAIGIEPAAWIGRGILPLERLITKYSYEDLNQAVQDMH